MRGPPSRLAFPPHASTEPRARIGTRVVFRRDFARAAERGARELGCAHRLCSSRRSSGSDSGAAGTGAASVDADTNRSDSFELRSDRDAPGPCSRADGAESRRRGSVGAGW